jgi:hypothetical protein
VPDRLGLGLTVLVLRSGVVWFVVAPDAFREHGHDAAAIPLFLAIVAVVWLNARDVQEAVQHGSMAAERRRYIGMYRTTSVAMLASLTATVAISLATRSTTPVLWAEVVLIALFAVFWVVQTTELRPARPASRTPARTVSVPPASADHGVRTRSSRNTSWAEEPFDGRLQATCSTPGPVRTVSVAVISQAAGSCVPSVQTLALMEDPSTRNLTH